MADNRILTANFRLSRRVKTASLYQYDYGQVLRFLGICLPDVYEVHFSNADGGGTAYTVLGNADGVMIPDALLATGNTVHAWIFLHDAATDGETEYKVEIPVIRRPKVTDAEPTPVQQDVITQAIAALNAGVETVEDAVAGVGEAIDTALQEAKDSGEFDGEDGYTPVKGVDYFDGQDGKDGEPGKDGATGPAGISPTISVTDITGGHRVTITDATGAHSFDVMDGEDGGEAVQDVQVNGVSVLSDGVANVPVASNSSFGVTKGNINQGIGVDSASKNLYISQASDSQVKAGISVYKPITPANQHQSAFYGLAKAAGDTTQSQSSNAVGTYTDDAKVAIQKMLGIYQPPWELLNDITLTEEGRIDLTADANGTPYDLLSVYVRVYYAANLTAASTGFARYLVEDSDGTTLNAETGRYTAQTTPYAKFVYFFRAGQMAIMVYSKAAATGGGMQWQSKDGSGVKFDFKNIQRIYMNTADVEPAGTRIQIYGQRAY